MATAVQQLSDDPVDDVPAFPSTDELGHTGVPHHGGIIDEEFHRDLAGSKAREVFKEMAENSSAFGAFLWLLEALIGQVPWEMRPQDGREDAESVRQAEWAETMRKDIGAGWRGGLQAGWQEYISQLVTHSATYGWSFHEIWMKKRRGDDPVGVFSSARERERHVSRYDDGLWGIGGLELRTADTFDHWDFDTSGRAIALWQRRPAPQWDTVRIPLERGHHFRIRPRTSSPEGRSLGRHAYPDYHAAMHARAFEQIGLENDMTGMPILECPPDITKANASTDKRAAFTNAKKMVRHLKRGEYEGAAIPCEEYTDATGTMIKTGYKLRPFQSGGSRQHDVDKVIRRYEVRQLQSVLAEFLYLGGDKFGSFALADSKTNTLAKSLGAIVARIIESFNRQVLWPLMSFNAFDRRFWPTLWAGDFETPELKDLASALRDLVDGRILTPDDKLERWTREKGKMTPHDPSTARERPAPKPREEKKAAPKPREEKKADDD